MWKHFTFFFFANYVLQLKKIKNRISIRLHIFDLEATKACCFCLCCPISCFLQPTHWTTWRPAMSAGQSTSTSRRHSWGWAPIGDRAWKTRLKDYSRWNDCLCPFLCRQVNRVSLSMSLTHRTFLTNKEHVTKPLSSEQASDCRDAFVKVTNPAQWRKVDPFPCWIKTQDERS